MKSLFPTVFFNCSPTLKKCIRGTVLLCVLFFYSGCRSIEEWERLAREEGNVEAQYYCTVYHRQEAYDYKEDAADAVPPKKPSLLRKEKEHWEKFEEFCRMAAENSHHEAQLLLIEHYFRKLNDSPGKLNDFKQILQKHARDAKTLECNSTKYVDRLLKLNTPEALEIALFHCDGCIFPQVKNNAKGIELANRLETAFRATVRRLESTGADTFKLTSGISTLRKKYPRFFVDIVDDIPISVPTRFKTSPAVGEKAQLLKNCTLFLENHTEWSKFKEMNPKAQIASFSEDNIIWARAVIKDEFFEKRYFFKGLREKLSDEKSDKFRAVLDRIELVPFHNKILKFQNTFSNFFINGTKETVELKVEDHLWTCDAFLNVHRRKVKLGGVSIQLYEAAHNVKIKPFSEKSSAFKAWREKMKAKANQKQLLKVETSSGFEERPVTAAVNFLQITPPRLKEVQEAFLKCHGMTVKIVLELNKQ